MRLNDDIDRDRRRRVLLLSERLDDFAAIRRELLLQLEQNSFYKLDAPISHVPEVIFEEAMHSRDRKRPDELPIAGREIIRQLVSLNAQGSAVQREHNSLCNFDAPISHLPSEVLAMIFEEGMHPQNVSYHFGVRVSHVTQHWRDVSITTPKLWTNIRCITRDDEPPYPEILTGRASIFLSRTRSSPLNIYIEGFREEDFSYNFLQLISDHIDHCRRLRIVGGQRTGLMRVLKCISSKPMPLLASIDLGCYRGLRILFHERLFPIGVSRLTTARFVDIDIQTMHLCLPAFASLQSLQLAEVCITTNHGAYLVYDDYHLFREALMALPSLRHLELFVKTFIVLTGPSRLPILLPMIQHLHVSYGRSPSHLSKLLQCIIAASLITLSLSNQNGNGPFELELAHSLKLHFPSLQHLILTDGIGAVPDLTTLARTFPYIERLTFKPASIDALLYNVNHVLDTILYGTGNGAGDGDGDRAGNNELSRLPWPRLQSIAISASREALDIPRLTSTIIKLQAAGHPIRELLLPQEVHLAMVEMREMIEIEEFYVDWPTPFGW